MKYKYRTIARIVITAKTPIHIGTGDKSLVSDATVCLDANGLPYIPGTSLTGLLRQGLDKSLGKELFGEKEGSKVIVSDACLVFENGKVAEGLLEEMTPFLRLYEDLPVRQHVRISHTGTAEKRGKFDEMVVFAGSRFCFEMEFLSEEDRTETFKTVAMQLFDSSFRIGGGSRRGFGVVTVNSIRYVSLCLEKDIDLYLSKSSSLNEDALDGRWKTVEPVNAQAGASGWKIYRIELTPQDFFLFSSGIGGDDSDIVPTLESIIEWEDDEPVVKTRRTLIPASSVKGALSHRTAFHYNRIKGLFADKGKDLHSLIGSRNPAVKVLFGGAGDDAARGNVLFSDVYLEATAPKKLDHVVIDNFTGGSLESGLFNEVVTCDSGPFVLELMVYLKACEEDAVIMPAFEAAIEDLCRGYLPLGGGVNRGHGVFNGRMISHEGN